MKNRQLEKEILRDFIQSIDVSNAIKLETLKSDNKVLKKVVAKLRHEVLLRDAFIEASDEQYDRLMVGVTGRVATVTPPAPGITRFHIGGVTEIADTRIRG